MRVFKIVLVAKITKHFFQVYPLYGAMFNYGRVIISDIDLFTHGLFKPDGTHLSAIGNDILLVSFQEAFRLFIKNPDQKTYEA